MDQDTGSTADDEARSLAEGIREFARRWALTPRDAEHRVLSHLDPQLVRPS